MVVVDFESWVYVVECFFECGDGVLIVFCFDIVEGVVDD